MKFKINYWTHLTFIKVKEHKVLYLFKTEYKKNDPDNTLARY